MIKFSYKRALMLISLGLAAGVLGGLLGIGGGALIVPGLVLLLGLSQHKAHGTSLAAVLLLAGAGVITYKAHGYVDYKTSLEMAAGGVVGALAGARVVRLVNARVLRRMFSVFIMLVAVRMMLDGFGIGSSTPMHPMVEGTGIARITAVLGIGVLTGFMSSLLGIGGGMVMIPALVILLSMPQKMAQGISLAVMIPTALVGVCLHRRMGNVDLSAGMLVGIGGAVGAVIGARIVVGVDASFLKIGFGVFLITMAALMVAKKAEPVKKVGKED